MVTRKSPSQRARARPRGPGRLTAADEALLPDRLRDAAQSVFLESGYARATMDAIAAKAGVSRKTLYARYSGKEAALQAVVDRLLESSLPIPTPDTSETRRDPRSQLLRIGSDLAQLAVLPEVAGLNRLIFAEAAQLPELGRLFVDLEERAAAAVAETLRQLAVNKAIVLPCKPEAAAALFIEMVSSRPRLFAMLGRPPTKAQLAADVEDAVNFFVAASTPARARTPQRGPRRRDR